MSSAACKDKVMNTGKVVVVILCSPIIKLNVESTRTHKLGRTRVGNYTTQASKPTK